MDEQKGQTLKNSAANSGIRAVTATGAPPYWGEEVWAWPSMRMDTSTRIEIPEAGDFDVARRLFGRHVGDAAAGHLRRSQSRTSRLDRLTYGFAAWIREAGI